MSDPSLCAEIVWKIKNFVYFWKFPFESEQFVVNTLDKSSWFVDFTIENSTNTYYIYLNRARSDNVNQNITVKVEIAVLDSENQPHHVKETVSKTYKLGQYSSGCVISLKTVRDNAEKYLPGNVFTFRFRMWLPDNKLATHITRATLVTEIPVSKCFFHWNIEKFLNTAIDSFKICYNSLFCSENLLEITLSYKNCDKENFFQCDIKGNPMQNAFLKCDIYIPATSEIFLAIDTNLDSLPCKKKINALVPQLQIIESDKYLINGSLPLLCKIVIASCDLIHNYSSSTLCKTKPFLIYSTSNNISEVHEDSNSSKNVFNNFATRNSNTLVRDTLRMYREGTMSDFSIHVGSKVFPVHTSILSSRSPVFHRMLETNMKEKNDKILKLDDLDEDIVSKMLEYMYSDDPGELNAESASRLYYVGDQYQMDGLKELSALYLKQNITTSNVCDILQLADQHNDADLKSFAFRFIRVHEKEVILSEEFETLSATNHKFCLEIFREITKSR